MKKNLLIQIICFLSVGALAQNSRQSSVVCESFVGTSPNQLTTAFGHKTNLWYDKDVDALSFVFCYDTANVGYAYSLDHGTTWTIDTMLYQAPSAAYRGRYPQGAIYNPAGNTNPSNAYVTCFGPTASMNAHYEGTSGIGSGVNQQNVYPFTTYPKTLFPQGGTIVKNTGTTWWTAPETTNGTEYNDTIVIAKGTFNGGNFSYSYTQLPVPVCTDNHGDKMFRNQAIIFDDSGYLGFLVVIGNNYGCSNGDSTMGLIIYKTWDSGNTWNLEGESSLSGAVALLANGGSCSASTELDLAMDQNNTLHIGMPIIPFLPGNLIYNSFSPGTWGLFDVTYDGLYIRFCLIAEPQQYYGQFTGTGPILNEDNRFQLSRNWDGTRIFYTWFDTDTMTFGTIGNLFPDMHSVGYDLASNLFSAEVNFTQFSGTTGDGNSIFGNVSYYTINDGTDENISVISDVMTAGTNDPISFFYIGCAPINNYVNGGNCTIINLIKNPAVNNPLLGECTIYPNPSSHQTFMDINLAGAADVSIEITNAIGQVFSSVTYKNLHAGKNTITIKTSSLSAGLYFYTLKAGNEEVTKMMSVE